MRHKLQVMNLNSAAVESVGCVGYIPKMEVSDAIAKGENYNRASHYLLQTCIGKVVEYIERRSRHGFRCRISGEDKLYFPRLGAMTLDSPERVKYFGLRNLRSCGTCRLRNGHSASRQSTRHDGDTIHTWLRMATNDTHVRADITARSSIRAKLKRHGWNYKHACKLNDVAKECLVDIPMFGHPPAPFAGLIQYERMHLLFINYCNYAMDELVACVPTSMYPVAYAQVKECHQFRDPHTGMTHPRLGSVLKMVHLTAERRVCAIFYWAHVLGTKAEIIVPALRVAAKEVVSTLQLMLIAVRGHRSYSKREFDYIFNTIGTRFFKNLETMAVYTDGERIRKGQQAHDRNPTRNRAPIPFRQQIR